MATTKHGSKHTHKNNHRNSHTSRHPSSHHSKRSSHRLDATHSSSRTRSSHHHHHHHHHGSGFTAYRAGAAKGRTASLVTLVLIAIGSLIFIAVGIWLLADRLGWPVPLNFTSNNDWTRFLSIGLLTFLTGVILLVLFVVGFLAYNGGSRIARAVATFFAALAFLLLFLVFLLCIIFAASSAGWLTDWWRSGWEKTRDSNPSWLCRYQQKHKCYGFENNDCANCDVSSKGIYTAGCTARQKQLCPACVPPSGSDSTSRFLAAIYASNTADAPPLSPTDPSASAAATKANARTVAFINEAGVPKTRLRPHVRTQGSVADPDTRPEPSNSPGPSPNANPGGASGGVGGGIASGGDGKTTGGGGTATGAGGTVAGAGLFTDYVGNGCKNSLRNDFREFMIPWAVFSLFLLIVVFLQFFFLCCVASK